MEHEQDIVEFEASFRKLALELSIPVPDSCLPLFFRYLCELKKWNKAINLTSIHDDEEILAKHFVDSIACLKVIEKEGQCDVFDVGSGAGFPGLPLKLMCPDLGLELLEPSEKKGAFLRYMVGSLGLQGVTVSTSKLQQYASRVSRRAFNYIVVRAFKVDESGQLLADLLKPGGKVILYRAEPVPKGFVLAGLALAEEVEYELPSDYGHRVLSVFSK